MCFLSKFTFEQSRDQISVILIMLTFKYAHLTLAELFFSLHLTHISKSGWFYARSFYDLLILLSWSRVFVSCEWLLQKQHKNALFFHFKPFWQMCEPVILSHETTAGAWNISLLTPGLASERWIDNEAQRSQAEACTQGLSSPVPKTVTQCVWMWFLLFPVFFAGSMGTSAKLQKIPISNRSIEYGVFEHLPYFAPESRKFSGRAPTKGNTYLIFLRFLTQTVPGSEQTCSIVFSFMFGHVTAEAIFAFATLSKCLFLGLGEVNTALITVFSLGFTNHDCCGKDACKSFFYCFSLGSVNFEIADFGWLDCCVSSKGSNILGLLKQIITGFFPFEWIFWNIATHDFFSCVALSRIRISAVGKLCFSPEFLCLESAGTKAEPKLCFCESNAPPGGRGLPKREDQKSRCSVQCFTEHNPFTWSAGTRKYKNQSIKWSKLSNHFSSSLDGHLQIDKIF